MKLFIDECLAPKTFKALAALVAFDKEPVKIEHLLDRFRPGTRDDIWAAHLQAEPGWIAVTVDSGGVNDGVPAPIILPKCRITGVFLARKLAQASGFEKARVLLSVYDQLRTRVVPAPPGTRFKLLRRDGRPVLDEWPLGMRPQPPPGRLF
ncbi:MAG: hypothetical protein ACKVS8_07950 [Phycisphaerales bacterium]